jgi:hypothetical protein
MKLMASVLLFYFSFLSVQPVLALMKPASSQAEQCTMSCCHKEKKSSKKQLPAGNCCNKDMCNPFAQYSCCLGFLIEDKHYAPVVTASTNSEIVSANNILIPNFCADCWHPPENSLS